VSGWPSRRRVLSTNRPKDWVEIDLAYLLGSD
jgi:hypothetical protein